MPRRSSTTTPRSRLDQLIRLWLLRLLVPLGGHQHFLRRHGINDDSVARAVGMAKWLAEDKDFDQKAALRDLRRLHADAERRCGLENMPGHLFEGTAALAGQVGLSYRIDERGSVTGALATARVKSRLTTTTAGVQRNIDIRFHPVVFTVHLGYTF